MKKLIKIIPLMSMPFLLSSCLLLSKLINGGGKKDSSESSQTSQSAEPSSGSTSSHPESSSQPYSSEPASWSSESSSSSSEHQSSSSSGQEVTYVTDVLNTTNIGLKTSTTYGPWSYTGKSGASYSGNSASGYDTIQLRSKNGNSGVIGNLVGHTCESISFTFHSETQSERTLDIYGSNSAFAIEDMFDGLTAVGSVSCSSGSATYTFKASYSYIGFKSPNGAVYVSSANITWSDAANPGGGGGGGGESSSQSSSQDSGTVNAAKIAELFNANLAADGQDFAAEWDSEYSEYYLGVSFGSSSDESKANLKDAAEIIASYLPTDVLTIVMEHYDDPNGEDYYNWYGDDSICYIIEYSNDDESSYVDVQSYIYEGELVVAVDIYDY